MVEQSGKSGRGSHRWYQGVPIETAGYHLSICMKSWPKYSSVYDILARGSHSTYPSIPLLNITDGINTSIKIPHKHKDFNPMQKMCCEKLVNCSLYF